MITVKYIGLRQKEIETILRAIDHDKHPKIALKLNNATKTKPDRIAKGLLKTLFDYFNR